MSTNIYKIAAVSALKSVPTRLPAWLLGVYAAELLKARAVEDTKKQMLADVIFKQTSRR